MVHTIEKVIKTLHSIGIKKIFTSDRGLAHVCNNFINRNTIHKNDKINDYYKMLNKKLVRVHIERVLNILKVGIKKWR